MQFVQIRETGLAKKSTKVIWLFLILAGVLFFNDVAMAQAIFKYNTFGDLLLGFRKTGDNQGSYELVADLGAVTNFTALAPGTVKNIDTARISPTQLSDAFSDFNNLQWSAFACFQGAGSWSGFPASTLWVTVPRPDFNTQSQPPQRDNSGPQQGARNAMLGVGNGAAAISMNLTSNIDCTAFLVREPVGGSQALTKFIGNQSDSTASDFGGNLGFYVENITPDPFNTPMRSDFYQSCNIGDTDPNTHTTTGDAYYVGYFQLNTDGTMTFTRASGTVAQPTLTVTRSGNTSKISFTAVAGATYTLLYTNSAGLTAPVANWPAVPATVTGSGPTNFTDTTTDAFRFYRVKAQ